MEKPLSSSSSPEKHPSLAFWFPRSMWLLSELLPLCFPCAPVTSHTGLSCFGDRLEHVIERGFLGSP